MGRCEWPRGAWLVAVASLVLSLLTGCDGRDTGTTEEEEARFVWTEGMIHLLPLPDFSMPFNTLALTVTAIMLFYGAVFRIATVPACANAPDPSPQRVALTDALRH
eukprot:Selendium_serpulae@DN2142_c0_g1_i2.p1